jgi:large subunit ribosomal protein L4
MAEINVVDQANKAVGKRKLNPAVFGLEADAGFVHRVYTTLAMAQRAGTHSTKTRAEVSGGGKKPWKQKGTGRARQGSNRAAQWRHGGTAHGPQPHDYTTRINKKERNKALCMALSDCLRDGRLTVVNKIELPGIKTKDFAKVVDALGADKGLFVLGTPDSVVELSARNLSAARIVLDGQLGLHDLLKCDRLVLTEAAVEKLEGRLA